MTYEPKMSYAEIGQELGLKATHVQVICVRALPKLKAKLLEKGIRFEDLEIAHPDGNVLGEL